MELPDLTEAEKNWLAALGLLGTVRRPAKVIPWPSKKWPQPKPGPS